MAIQTDRRLLVNLYGLPAVGKTTLRNALIEAFGGENCGKVLGDHYLKSKPSNVSFFEYFTDENYDWDLLQKHLNFPLGEIVSPPRFDFTNFVRISDSGYFKKFTIKQLNFLDTAGHCPFADLHVLIVLDPEDREKRIIQRGETDYFWKKFVLSNWKKIKLLDAEREKVFRTKADLILNGSNSVEMSVQEVIKLINRAFTK